MSVRDGAANTRAEAAMNNYTGFNFLPSPTRPASKVRHVVDAATVPSTGASDAAVQRTAAADHVFPPVSGQA
ncbi:MAG: hypothetical protein ACRYG8_46315 [Janthinobacterium lividum]